MNRKTKLIDPFLFFSLITVVLFVLYEKYLGKIIIFFHISWIPHTRTVQATILKYMPLMFILVGVYFLLKKLYEANKDS